MGDPILSEVEQAIGGGKLVPIVGAGVSSATATMPSLKKAGALYPNRLGTELKNATDEYARAVRELSLQLRAKTRHDMVE